MAMKYQPSWQLNEILDRISLEQMAWPDNFEDTQDLIEKIEECIEDNKGYTELDLEEAREEGYREGYDEGYDAHNDILSGGHS